MAASGPNHLVCQLAGLTRRLPPVPQGPLGSVAAGVVPLAPIDTFAERCERLDDDATQEKAHLYAVAVRAVSGGWAFVIDKNAARKNHPASLIPKNVPNLCKALFSRDFFFFKSEVFNFNLFYGFLRSKPPFSTVSFSILLS